MSNVRMLFAQRSRGIPRLAVTLILTTILTLAVTACGSSDDSDDKTPGAGSGTPGSTGGDPSGAPVPGSLNALAAAYLAGVDGKVTNQYTTINFGQHPKGIWTLYNEGDNFRQDWFSDGGGIEATTIVIVRSDEAYLCTKIGETSCRREPEELVRGVLPIFGPVKEILQAIVDGVAGLESNELQDETIAGLTAKCFDLQLDGRIGVGPDGSESMKICFSDDGHLLLLKRVITFLDPALPVAELNLEAQEVTEASASDFEAPDPPSN